MRSFRPRPQGRFKASNEAKVLHQIEQFITESKTITGEPTQVSIEHSFRDFDFPQGVLQNIAHLGYTQLTPIQDKVIPLVLANKDVIGIANTGTGKTAAFLLPLITKVLNQTLHQVLILAPTRELAVQIQQDFEAFSRGSRLTSSLCIGGTSIRGQINQLRRPYQFLIGTPGRIKDMLSQHYIRLAQFDAVVLDEVDRMLDMGFIRDVREILAELPSKRQTLFFSATLPKEVERISFTFAHEPVMVSAKTTEYAHTVTQKIVKLPAEAKKLETLYDLLCHQDEFKKVIIFGRTKHGVKRLAQELDHRGFAVDSLHGNKSQAARQRSLTLFKQNRISVLVATDVAARGIDVLDITHVINYDLPETVEDYIHRIGRTGRAGSTGTAITLINHIGS